MFSEKATHTVPATSEVTDLAHITENEDQPELLSSIPTRSILRGCLQVLGAFFIFFNVWLGNSPMHCYFIQRLTPQQGPKLRIWILPKLLWTRIHSIIYRVRHSMDRHNPIMASNCRRATIWPAFRPRLLQSDDICRKFLRRYWYDDAQSCKYILCDIFESRGMHGSRIWAALCAQYCIG